MRTNTRSQSRSRNGRALAQKTALEKIDELLGQGEDAWYAERIRLMRIAMFSDVEELEKSGTVKIPK